MKKTGIFIIYDPFDHAQDRFVIIDPFDVAQDRFMILLRIIRVYLRSSAVRIL